MSLYGYDLRALVRLDQTCRTRVGWALCINSSRIQSRSWLAPLPCQPYIKPSFLGTRLYGTSEARKLPTAE